MTQDLNSILIILAFMQPSPPPSLFQHLKSCELEPATVSHGVPWRTQNLCIKTQVKTYLYGTGILSSSALGCSMCLTSYCNNTVTRKDKFKSTELKFLVLLVWSVLKKKKKKSWANFCHFLKFYYFSP